MQDNHLLWMTDRELHVTSLSARLRDQRFPDGIPDRLHVSQLWREDDPFGLIVVAHHWALDGEPTAFETVCGGEPLRITLEPLYDLSGAITGVGGRALGVGDGQSEWETQALDEIERLCGYGTWRTDIALGHTRWSKGLYEIFGIDPAALPGDIRANDHPEDAQAVADAIREGEIGGSGYRCDHRIVRSDGSVRYVQEQAHIVYDPDGTARAHAGSIIDITDRKLTEAHLAELAHYDPVSKLPNRRLLEERLHASLARGRLHGTMCAVLFLDVDNFKRVNDTFGHARGDELLALIGTRLSHYVRPGDTVARMSGDEFVIVLDDLTSPDDALGAAHKILRSFEMPFHLGERDCRVGVSIGISVYPLCSTHANELVDIADSEMYIVKRNGGRGIKMACPNSSADRLTLRTAASA